MPRRTTWHIGAQVVTRADVRQWMQSVAARIPARSWWAYVREWDVPAKIAREKAAGTFADTVTEAAACAGVRVRAARRPGRIARLRAAWPEAANDDAIAIEPRQAGRAVLEHAARSALLRSIERPRSRAWRWAPSPTDFSRARSPRERGPPAVAFLYAPQDTNPAGGG